ncbi:hypothetical protein Goshw_014489, partial [Gossypium schwendimanii]|nr:hypothetical protein [Gossypium schwendimanii]
AQAIFVRSSRCKIRKYSNRPNLVTQRDVIGLLFGFSIISLIYRWCQLATRRKAENYVMMPAKRRLKMYGEIA